MTDLREADVPELRRVVEESLDPQKLLIRRGHGGSLMLRILSDRFEDVDNPRGKLEAVLKKHGVRLPERALTILKAPSDLEDDLDRELFFPQGRQGGVPNWAEALSNEPARPVPADDRDFGATVVAFWGLKGGVGRSTALAHVADYLAQRKRVLAIDLDLESPALVSILTNGNSGSSHGRIEDLVRESESASDEDFSRAVQRSLRRSVDTHNPIDVLGPLVADGPYVRSLLGPLAPAALYRGGQGALRRVVRQAIQVTDAELVLVDARSGYCDDSAIAVLDLADEVVLFASPAPSTFPSLAPAVEALERNRQAIGRPRAVHVVASMLPAGEEARKRIHEDLRVTLESFQADVARTLDTRNGDLPPEPSIVSIDYTPRIVENEGTLLRNVSDGYREIAERICPAPTPVGLISIEKGWVGKVLREALIPVTQAEDEKDPDRLADLFTRTPDLAQFARQDVCLVLGAKGTGKSFLRRMCLDNQRLLVERSGVRALAGVTFVDGYSQPRGGSHRRPLVTKELLRRLDEELGEQWRNIWSALALGRVAADLRDELGDALAGHSRTQFQQIRRLAQAEESKMVFTEVKRLLKDPLALDDAWQKLDRWCEQTNKTFILLFDDLDVALGEATENLERRKVMIQGLLDRANESWMSQRHLGVKIFLREDVFRDLGSQEEAKYNSRSVNLHWRPEDMWRLMVRAMAIASSTFRIHMEGQGLLLDRLEEAPEDDWSKALQLIWGQRLGPSESQTRSSVWAHRRLRDGAGRMFPRAALWLLRAAIENRRSRLSREPSAPLLDGRSLRDAMPVVAKERFVELKQESSVEEKARLDRLRRMKAYQNEVDFFEALKQAGENAPAEALAVFKRLGIVESSRRRDGTPTVRIVDLYAFSPELEIERSGRR